MQILSVRLLRALACGLLTVLVVSTVVSTAEAGQNRWTPFGLGGGLVLSLAVDPDVPGVVYAATALGGIYRSTDAGRTWQWRGAVTPSLGLWTEVIVAPNDPQRLYATTDPGFQAGAGRVYTSGDGGGHWQELFQHPGGFNAVAASPNGTLLAAGEDAEVYRSADGGLTWTLVLDPETGSLHDLQLAFDPLAPEIAYVGSFGGLWQSTDSGATWSRIGTLPGGEPVEGVSALAFPGTQPGFLYALMGSRLVRSEDGGLTWSGGVPLPGGNQDIAVDPADPRTVYVAGLSVYVSHDGGDTAAELPVPDTAPYIGHLAIAVSPAAPETLYLAVTGLGVLVSTDAGEHWTLGEQRGLTANNLSPGGFLAAPSGRLYQAEGIRQNGNVFRSLDRGASWSALTPVPGTLLDLTEEAGAPNSLWAASNPLFHSTDGGASWSPVPLSTPSSHVASPAPRVVLAGGGCGLQRSTDGGRTWKRLFTCAPDRGEIDIIQGLDVPPGWPGAVLADVEARRSGQSTRKVLLSLDAGKTWRTLAQSTNASIHLHAAASRRVIYLRRNNTLQRSSDAGATWATVAVPGPFLSVAVDAANPDILYLGTETRGVLRSANGGGTWRAINAGLAPLGRLWVPDVVTDPKVPFTAYAFPAKGGIFQGRFGN
jgi:photosystem II stability/assembly factor-like uncharacterized protein